MRIASGRFRLGFFASSPAAATLSRPTKLKKMTPAAAETPAKPNGAKGVRLSEFQPWTPMTMNMISTQILMTTMTALVLADSLTPRMSNSEHMMIRMTAGRLMTPPCTRATPGPRSVTHAAKSEILEWLPITRMRKPMYGIAVVFATALLMVLHTWRYRS